MTEKLTLSVEEAGKVLGVSRQIAYKLSRQADFPTLSDLEIARKEALRELMRSAAAQIVAEVTEE